MPSPPTAYDGLYELSNECWRCLGVRVYEASAAVPRMPIVGNAPGVFDDIRNFLQNVLNLLSGYTISHWVRNWLLPLAVPYINWHLVEPFQNFVSGIRTSIVSALNWGASHIYNPLSSISTWLSTIRYNLSSWLRSAAAEGLWVLLNPLQAASNVLTWLYQALPSWVRDPLNNLAGNVWNGLWSLKTFIGGFIDALRTGLATVVSNAAETIRNELFWLRVAADWIRSTLPYHLSMIGTTAVTLFTNWLTFAFPTWFLQVMLSCVGVTTPAVTIGLPIIKSLWAGVSSIPSTYLSWLSSTCGTDLALTPSRALASVGGLYGMAITAGTVAMGISTALNLIPTLNWVGAAQLAGFVSEAAAFDPLTKATYGTLINDVLTVPLRYHWNQQMRPYLPTIGEIYTMGRKHGLSMSEFQTAMAYQGLPNWWITKIYDFFWTDPSPMWLLRMTEGGIPTITTSGRKGPWLDQWIPNWRSDPMAWLKMKLMLSGFEDIDIDPMISGMRMRSVTGAVTQTKTSARAMLRDAYWTEANASAFLTPLGVRPEEIRMMMLAEELDYQHEYLDDQVTYYVEAFRKGQLSDQNLNLALTTIYVKPARVAQVIAREKIRKLPTPKSVTPVELNPAVTRLRTQAINSWIAQYHAWAISQEDLLLSLTIIVQDPALAKSMVAVEITRFRPAPPAPKPPAEDPLLAAARRQAIATWVTAYRDGEIGADELERYLVPLIANATLRKQLVELEKLRKPPKPEVTPPVKEAPAVTRLRTQAINSWIAQYHAWEISKEDLLLSLTIIVQDPALAKSMVAVEITRFRPAPPAPKPPAEDPLLASAKRQAIATWVTAFRDGRISADELERYLVPLIADAALRQQLVELEKLRSPPPPEVIPPFKEDPAVTQLRTQAINSWIAQYRAWEISEADLLQSLTIIVQDAVLAQNMVNVEKTRFRPPLPTPKPPAEDPLLAAAKRQTIATWVTAFRDGKIVADELELYLQPFIPDTALRKQLVELEKLRYSLTPELIALATENEEMAKVRAEYVRGHIEMFATRLITIDQLYQFLQVDGLVDPLARATAITQATKRIQMPAIASPYYMQAQHAELIAAGLQMYEDAYMAGEITLAQYQAWITTLVKDQDVVTYLADVLVLRKFAESV